jgi:hypothetical protein
MLPFSFFALPSYPCSFCTFQEVMFVSAKYSILASPGHIVSTPSRTSQDNLRRLNRLRTRPGTADFGDVGVGVSADSSLHLVSQRLIPVTIPKITIAGRTLSAASADNVPIAIPPRSTDHFNDRLHACRDGRRIATLKVFTQTGMSPPSNTPRIFAMRSTNSFTN